MKYFVSLLILLPHLLMGQQFHFHMNYELGRISKYYLHEDKIVIGVQSNINEIFIFNSKETAKVFLNNPKSAVKPQKKIELGNVNLYVNQLNSITYYTLDTPQGEAGQIKSVNGVSFSYAPNYSYNQNAGVVGYLVNIGNLKIKYCTDKAYENYKCRGKINSINNLKFVYERWSSWGEKANMVGEILKIGDIDINYYDTDYAIGYKGKIKSIGNIIFKYYDNSYNNKKANIVGKFKGTTGNDSRVIIR